MRADALGVPPAVARAGAVGDGGRACHVPAHGVVDHSPGRLPHAAVLALHEPHREWTLHCKRAVIFEVALWTVGPHAAALELHEPQRNWPLPWARAPL